MLVRKSVFVAAILALAVALAVPAIRAGETDQMTKFQFTFAKPIEVPGMTLDAGTYWFKIQDAQNAKNDQEKNMIAIYDANNSKVIATVPARPVQRKSQGYGTARSTPEMNGVELHIANGGAGRAATMVSWFYPGTYTGHQFVYSDKDQKRVDEETQQTVLLKAEKHSDGNYGATFSD